MSTSAAADLDFARALVAQALAAGADQAQARVAVNQRTEVDFDTRHLSLLRTTSDDETLLTLFKATRKGAAGLTGRAPEMVAQAIAQAMAAAEAGPPDPANAISVTPPGAATEHGPVAADRDHLIDRSQEHIALMAREYPAIISRECYHQFNRTRRSFANSAGVERQETRGRYSFVTLFAGRRDGRSTSFNYHGGSSYTPYQRLIEVGVLRQLYDDAIRSFDARPAPGKFVGDIIVTPDALGELLVNPLVGVLTGYSLMAGTSPYKDRQGQAIASSKFSLLNRPTPASFPEGVDFDGHGIPTTDLDVIRDGVLKEFLVDEYISRKLARPRTAVYSLFQVPPGAMSVAEIIAATERGILLTRFSGGVPGANLEFSGIAKNAFYVEGGQLRHPLSETMISGNLRDLLLAIRAVSRETVNFGSAEFPTIAAGGVTIHGRSG